MEGLRAPKLFTAHLETPEQHSKHCLNCSAEMVGPFCAQCGQRDIPPYPSIRELATDAFWELSGWDGRFAATVRAVVRAPGELTVAFLEGRRARYISPLRLYLLASLMYFLAAAAAPEPVVLPGASLTAPGVVIGPGNAPSRVATAGVKARSRELTPAERDSALKDLAHAPSILRPILRRMVTDGAGFKRSLLEIMPRLQFALTPVFAAIVGLFYRRRKYPEHLYFGLHLHSFFFVALTISVLAKFTHISWLSSLVTAGVALWILLYSVTAARRVYGGSIAKTVAKGAAIISIYIFPALAGLMIAIYIAALRG
jgi:hypothetical protein